MRRTDTYFLKFIIWELVAEIPFVILFVKAMKNDLVNMEIKDSILLFAAAFISFYIILFFEMKIFSDVDDNGVLARILSYHFIGFATSRILWIVYFG